MNQKIQTVLTETQKQIIELQYQEKTTAELSDRLGVGRPVIRRYARHIGLPDKEAGPPEKPLKEKKVKVWGYVKQKYYSKAQKEITALIQKYR